MIKIIIADDEILEREVYKVIISRHFPELVVVAEAETGRQAIEMYELHRPHLILMDVKMPGINGIDAIEEIRKKSRNAKFIIISAYNFFDYAKEAMKYGIEDYILKPVAKDEFMKVIGKALKKIEDEINIEKQELELKEKLKSVLPILENELTFAVMMSDDSKIKQYSKLINVDISSGYLVVGLIKEDSFETTNEVARSLTIQKIQEFIKENMPELKPCLISSFVSNKILMIFPWKTEISTYEIKEDSYNKMLILRNAIKSNFKVKMCFGISDAYKDLTQIRNSYNQALTVINNIDSFEIDIVNYGDIKSNAVKPFQYPYEIEKQLTEKIRLGITEQALRAFVSIFDYTRDCLKGDVDRIKFELLELYFALSRMVYEYDTAYIGLDDFIMNKNKYHNLKTIIEIYHIFEENIKSLCEKFKEERNKKAKSIMFQAIQYVNENYMKEITLEEVAKKVCISPNYFSRMFKSELNQNFIDYLTHIRIETAKGLIIKENKNISDVCWDVGYNDPNYFTKVFKKVTGLTPSEFKEKA